MLKKKLTEVISNNKIILELDQNVFHKHQAISGTVKLDLECDVSFLCLCVYIYGKEKVWLSIGHGDDNYHKKEVRLFLEHRLYLIGTGDKKPEKTKLPKGIHEYRFEYPLPADNPLPPSLDLGNGKTGNYYGCWAHIEDSDTWSANKGKNIKRKRSKKVKECFVPFYCFGRFFLEPQTSKIVNFTATKKLALGSPPLEFNVKMARNVFYVGETMKVRITVTNNTSKSIKRINSMILPQLFQRAQGKELNSRMPQINETKQNDSGVAANSTRTFHFEILIPNEVYPSYDTGTLLKYSNSLLFRIFIPGTSFMEVAIPIIVQVRGLNNIGEIDVDTTHDDDYPIDVVDEEPESANSCCCSIQ